MFHIKHRIGIKSKADRVYEALSSTQGISNWWTKDTTGESSVGSIVTTRFNSPAGAEVGSMKFEILELVPAKKVRWKFIEGPKEWIGTEVVFGISQDGEFTIVLFSHLNWAEEVEFKAHCSMKWAVFLLSLKQLVEQGQGNPSPGDFKIDNWN